jgi:hypothetical protein
LQATDCLVCVRTSLALQLDGHWRLCRDGAEGAALWGIAVVVRHAIIMILDKRRPATVFLASVRKAMRRDGQGGVLGRMVKPRTALGGGDEAFRGLIPRVCYVRPLIASLLAHRCTPCNARSLADGLVMNG